MLAGSAASRTTSSSPTWSAPTTASSSRGAAARSSCSSRPAASIRSRALERARAATRADSRFELAAEQPLPGASRAGIAEDFPLERRADALRRDEARRRAADRGVPSRLRPARGDQPLRRDRRALADGQGRPGRVHLLDARPPLPAPAALHRLRRHRASRCATCCTSTTSSTCSTSSSPSRSAGTA